VRIHGAVQLREYGDEGGPPGLMAGAEACTVVTMEVLMKRNAVVPVWVALEFLRPTEDRTPTRLIAQEDALQAIGKLLTNLEECHQPA
jgi:hypothetical protein